MEGKTRIFTGKNGYVVRQIGDERKEEKLVRGEYKMCIILHPDGRKDLRKFEIMSTPQPHLLWCDCEFPRIHSSGKHIDGVYYVSIAVWHKSGCFFLKDKPHPHSEKLLSGHTYGPIVLAKYDDKYLDCDEYDFLRVMRYVA
jgi:hypothetical protein